MTVYGDVNPLVIPISEGQEVSPPFSRAACQLTNTDNNVGFYYPGWVAGDRYVDFHNPDDCATPPTYPFEIQSLDLTLYDDGAQTWPCTLAVVVFEADLQDTLPDTCWYPGIEVCRQVWICEPATFMYPTVGTITFANPCCVDGPFYIGVEYLGVGVGTVQWPSPLLDLQLVDTCDVWVDILGTGWVVHHLTGFVGSGYPLWWVNGDTDSPNCVDTCNWQPGDPHKMHFAQLPDTTGWDVNATWPVVLADDWECSETGWVKDIHFWGSWRDGIQGEISQFVLSIHEDIPAGTICVDTTWATGDCNGDGLINILDITYLIAYIYQGGPPPDPLWIADMNGDCVIDDIDIDWLTNGYPVVPACCELADYSMPGQKVWSAEIFPWQFDATPYDPPTLEGWYDPSTDDVRWNNHSEYFQYDVCLDSLLWFPQDSGTIYWLNISAMVLDTPYTAWGWKSTEYHWNDDAVWDSMEITAWQDLYEPGTGGSWDTLVNGFFVIVDESGNVIEGGGEDAFGLGWYFYPWYEWWNIWFYDHPFDTSRYKAGSIFIYVEPYGPGPMFIELAVNWSTDLYAYDYPHDTIPPLPGIDEDLYIGREILVATDVPGVYELPYDIPWYNPEWVSVDIRGYNYVIHDGSIIHECRPKVSDEQSLDLSFVITGEPDIPQDGACCDTFGNCYTMNAADCAAMGGLYEGDGTSCTPNPCDSCDFQDPGDLNGDGVYNINDLIWLINFLYRGGPPPLNMANADVNGDCCIDWRDVYYYVEYLFMSGPPPVNCTCVQPPVCVDDPIPYTPGTVYHNVDGYFPSAGPPFGTHWHELYPDFCTDWTLIQWLDNGDGYLSFCDTILLQDAWRIRKEHVIKVMPTITLVDTLTGDTVYMDLIDPPNPMVLPMGNALGTQWHQVYPDYCRTYQLVYWPGVFVQAAIAVGDQIWMQGLNGPDSALTKIYILLAFETDMITENISCCLLRGDIDHDGVGPNIADLVYLVTYMFQNGPEPPCDEPYLPDCPEHYFAETDIDGNGTCNPDIADLVYLVSYMFQGGPPPVPCP